MKTLHRLISTGNYIIWYELKVRQGVVDREGSEVDSWLLEVWKLLERTVQDE